MDFISIDKLTLVLTMEIFLFFFQSHFFKSADQYFPNVAGFFRGYVDRALEMAENGIKYTLAKKVKNIVLIRNHFYL